MDMVWRCSPVIFVSCDCVKSSLHLIWQSLQVEGNHFSEFTSFLHTTFCTFELAFKVWANHFLYSWMRIWLSFLWSAADLGMSDGWSISVCYDGINPWFWFRKVWSVVLLVWCFCFYIFAPRVWAGDYFACEFLLGWWGCWWDYCRRKQGKRTSLQLVLCMRWRFSGMFDMRSSIEFSWTSSPHTVSWYQILHVIDYLWGRQID
jgi:hypothetical protein